MKPSKNIMLYGVFAGLFSMICFSSYSVMGKILLENLSPETMAAIGQTISVVTILLFFGFFPEIKKAYSLGRNKLILLWVIATLSAVFAPILLLKGLTMTTAINAVLVGRLEPVIAGAISYFWLKEKITMHQLIGAFVMFIGVLFIISGGSLSFSVLDTGSLYVIGAAASWALATNIFKKYLDDISPELVVLIRNTVGATTLFLILPFFFDINHNISGELLRYEILLPLVMFALFTIIGAQFFWYKTLELVSASTASSISLTTPIFGVALSYLVLGESIESYHYIGGIFIFIGLVLTVFHHKKHPKHHILERIRNFHS
ncbi:MAG: DMT family transporter [Patescibacteria group bacterium]|nr:DMT family transporter [Patescibacteria group bacterium]